MEPIIPGEPVLLTQYSRGAGCGCKIAPQLLEEILQSQQIAVPDKNLLVGNESKDDAAVYDLGNGTALISTTDFFMPIVDDAFDFGRIAAANAISDVYAMGGKPILALAILGWPVETLPAMLAQKVLEGARTVCAEAGIALAGGHSVDSMEPIFGLVVNGLVAVENIKKNNTAKEGDLLFLTKKIGVGVLSSARKQKILKAEHDALQIRQLTTLNKIGEALGKLQGVRALTDVTGFGLAGHLIEMAEGAGLSAELHYSKIPVLEGTVEYIAQKAIPNATTRNWKSYGHKIAFEKGVNVMEAFNLLPDPQTNGGILFAVDPAFADAAKDLLKKYGLEEFLEPLGKFTAAQNKTLLVCL